MLFTWLSVLLFGFFYVVSGKSVYSQQKPHPNCTKTVPTIKVKAKFGAKLLQGSQFYIPFTSSQAVAQLSELISGRRIDMEKDLAKLCFQVTIKNFRLQMTGVEGHFLAQDCSVTTPGSNYCVASPSTENFEQQSHGDGHFTIVWTDNKGIMAVVRCTSDGLHNDWYVFSMSPSLNETVKTDIVDVMNKYGFNPTPQEQITIPYAGCTLFPAEKEGKKEKGK